MGGVRLEPAAVWVHSDRQHLTTHSARRTIHAVGTPPDDPHGTDLLAQEIREEAGRLVHHPIAEVKRLESVAEEGDSAATPLILFIGVAILLAVIAAVVVALVFFAYYEG